MDISKAQGQPPHEALFLVLPYLAVQELLATSETCSSLRDSVRNDDGVLPWQNVVVEKPLSRRLTDASLARVASMARGNLRTLALIDCVNVTDDGLQRIIQTNPLIDKVYMYVRVFEDLDLIINMFEFCLVDKKWLVDFSCLQTKPT